ncbi:MAG: hypothetical protein IJS74_03025, partial [Clostridia bacterium]|nr:hypothetical protein [Clostridia bacterium]
MTREEYVKIYQAQQAKLKEKQPTQVVISAFENELLEKAAIFAEGQIVDLDTHSIDDIYDLIEIVFGLLEKVKDNKKINDLLILLDALQLIVDEDELEKEEK